MPKKGKAAAKEPDPEPEPELQDAQPEERLPPVQYPMPAEDPARVHPATIGYEQCGYGTLTWDVSQISTVCLGSIWHRRTPQLYSDPRVVHPATVGFETDLTPGKALNPAAVDPACVNP